MKNKFAIVCFMLFSVVSAMAQNDMPLDAGEKEPDMDSPTFKPMLRIGKVLDGKDSIQYVELNKIWVYPQNEFKNARQQQAYNRLVYNIKKVLPIAKEVNQIVQET